MAGRSLKRIDTVDSAYELSRAIREKTGGEITSLALGRTRPIEGVEGGVKRQITARIDGERRSYLAVAVEGRVHIIDGRHDQERNYLHEFLKHVDERREQRHDSIKANDQEEAQAVGTASHSNAPVAKGTNTAALASTVKPPAKAAGWPERKAAETISNQTRAVARRR